LFTRQIRIYIKTIGMTTTRRRRRSSSRQRKYQKRDRCMHNKQ